MMDSLKSSSSSSARKLPIKRRPPPLFSSSTSPPSPSSTLPYSDADEDPSSDSLHPPPFKFQRIWSESDEIRFLQGLLGCHAQSMVFPRDLNLFFDRFSEHMAQPFTRSQLSEKLRRLRTKFRIMSARIHRGQDPSRLAPHDRDILHLCTRLWHPDYSATSPFSSPDAGGGSNKRRRRNPRPLPSASPSQPSPALPALPVAQEDDKSTVNILGESEPPQILAKEEEEEEEEEEEDVVVAGEEEVDGLAVNGVVADEQEVKPHALPVKVAEAAGFATIPTYGGGNVVKKIVLDVFNECVKEVQKALDDRQVEHMETELSKRWREQQALELDVLSRRLRLHESKL